MDPADRFTESTVLYQKVIDDEVYKMSRRSNAWRLEPDDLRQECLLALWEAWPDWASAENPGGMCRVICQRALMKYERKAKKDALHSSDNYGLNPGKVLR